MARLTKELVMFGKEPTWETGNKNTIHTALYWYRIMKPNSIKKIWAIDYLKNYGFVESELDLIPEFHLSSVGAIARMINRGYKPQQNDIDNILERVQKLIKKYSVIEVEENKPVGGKYPHQIDVVGKKIGSQYEKFDLIIDNIIGGTTKWKVPEISDSLNKTNLLEIQKYYTQALGEYYSVYNSTDEEIEEYYDIPRLTLRRLIKFHEEILEKLQSKISIKSTKPVRKKKISKISPVKKLKFLSIDNETGISSKNPEKIIGAMKLVVFNTKNRQLIIYHAKNENGLSVKGTTIEDFDENLSGGKTLRKPKQQLPQFVTSAKLKTNTLFDNIKAVKKSVNGRVNSNCIIVNIFK